VAPAWLAFVAAMIALVVNIDFVHSERRDVRERELVDQRCIWPAMR
jgi:hypothetical protein